MSSTSNAKIQGDNTVLWGTSGGASVAGIIISVRDQLTGEIVEVPDENGFATAVVFFNDKHECECQVAIQTTAPALTRGMVVSIAGNANCLVTDVEITWEQKGVRKCNVKATQYVNITGTNN